MEEEIGGAPQTRRERRKLKKYAETYASDSKQQKSMQNAIDKYHYGIDPYKEDMGVVTTGSGIMSQIEGHSVGSTISNQSEFMQALERMNSAYYKYSEPAELRLAKIAESMNKMGLTSLLEFENGSRIVFKDGQWMVSFQSVEEKRINKINLDFGG